MKILAPGFVVVIILTLLLLSSSCGKLPDDPIPEDTTAVESLPYDIIWQTPQNITDSSGSFSPHFTPVIIGELVLSSNNVYSDFLNDQDIDTITAYNIHTGDIVWKWSDFQTSTKYVTQNIADNGILYITNSQEVIGIDGKTGKTILRRKSAFGQETFSVSKDILFHVDESAGYLFGDVLFYNETNFKWEQIVRVHRREQFQIFVYPPTADFAPNGDTLLYFHSRFHQSTPFISGCELHCFNMTSNKMIWSSIADSTTSNIKNTPYVDDSRVYFCSAKTVHCFDKFTGERIWKTHFPNTNFLATNYLMTEDKIIIGSDNGERIGVRKSDGKVVYNIKSYASSFWRLNRYKNWLLNVHKQLEIYDINTGEQKIFLNTTHKKGYFNTGVAVDENTGLFYLPDGYNMMCIRVKDL